MIIFFICKYLTAKHIYLIPYRFHLLAHDLRYSGNCISYSCKILTIGNIMTDNEQAASRKSSYGTDLQDFKNINNSLMQDALRVWSDLWAELDSSGNHISKPDTQMSSCNTRRSQIEDGFEPSCGFPEFVKKMWILRSYLDFAKRISR
jgi:hypothetical protein